jgi:hypothetical protein
MLASIEFDKQAVRSHNEIVGVRQVVGSQCNAAQKFGENLSTVRVLKRLEILQQFLGRLRHEISVPSLAFVVKSGVRSERRNFEKR